MEQVSRPLHMNGGMSETSYSSNSSAQKKAINMTKAMLEEAILDINIRFYSSNVSPTEKMNKLCVADLGCSSGPNTLLVVSFLLDAVYKNCREHHMVTPEILVFLNDLPGNDFNTLFKYLENFHNQLRKKGDRFGPCFVAGMPGTFYGRLFPSGTLHFAHSSYCLHWLSQVTTAAVLLAPKFVIRELIYISKSSPPSVIEAYLKQFTNDIRVFLECRSEELVDGGRMVLTLIGRRSSDPTSIECCTLPELLGMALKDMVIKVYIQ
ncbi:hypothetical protein MKW94_017804 [Papaver nudicaule]|uniref:Uncharacterized protein n=1 Tax=Papaver nudicaule TaxID=74823 RepID=A0AA41VAN8_PAPNU|nr:hypothetical protein [Papaver nudicaule]